MTNNEKLEVIDRVWRPPPGYNFPKHVENGRHWRINDAYLTPSSPKYFFWLVYSAYFDGVFCLPCVLFGQSTTNSKLQKLFLEPFTRWNSAPKRWKDHQDLSKVHKNSVATMQLFISEMKGTRQRINVVMNEKKREMIRQNGEKLIPILKTVLLCARQNIPLRGHRDDSKHYDDVSNNPGNFQVLLDFRIDSGDKTLEEHFRTAARNATYRSKTIQNELISSCGKFIRRSIVKDVEKAGFYSIIADEASDCSQVEQLSFVVRFIDHQSGEIREEFLEFIECESTSAEYLTNKLKAALQKLSLDLNDLRGQSYDGAGNMAGAKSGVGARIKNEYPKA